MNLNRREVLKSLTVAAVSTFLMPEGHIFASTTPLPRMPLEEFGQDATLVAALRKGVRAMKARKPSDPLSWFYQAAIHGVTPDAIKKAAADDPKVDAVFKKRYWNQCPHDGENSANFLPWHRGYTYYFERILRMHTEDDRFSLPYWNYTEKTNRKFPREFGIKHLDGNLDNDDPANINPLYMAERDFYFTGYEHPFATGLPLLELSDSAVDISLPMDAPIFFGETEREGLGGGIADEDPSTRGLLESYPHDQIHRAVGGIIDSSTGEASVGAMATPPTAGFDPIFSIHHSNIDRLWAAWSCMAGKSWGKLPSDYWFEERPWFFFDTNGSVINEPRRKYFDYRALGIRFKYENLTCKPLALPSRASAQLRSEIVVQERLQQFELLKTVEKPITLLPAGRSFIPLMPLMQDQLTAALSVSKSEAVTTPATRQPKRVLLRLQRVRLGTIESTGFDLHLTTDRTRSLSRNDPSFIGSIALFRHPEVMHDVHIGSGMDETFDITKALAAHNGSAEGIGIVAVPYALLTTAGGGSPEASKQRLRVDGISLLSAH